MVLSMAVGYSVEYLLGPVAGGRESYYTGAVAAGEPPGRWYGAGARHLGLRGKVDADAMEALYCHRIDPRDPAGQTRATWGEAATLGGPPRRYRDADALYEERASAEPGAGPERRAEIRREAERAARQDVAFVDATFSAPKSVTVVAVACERAENDALRAAERAEARAAAQEARPGQQARPGQASAEQERERAARYRAEAKAWATQRAAVERAVMAGARAAIDYLQQHAGYSRLGHHGGGAGRWIDAHDFTVAQFLQHDSRDRDPQLHVHQAILTRVQCADGKWRKLDTRLLWAHRTGAAAHAERVMEAHLARDLGLRLETRPDGKAREVVGVPRAVTDLFSKRRRSVTAEVDRLVAAYQARHQREPSPLERAHIAQQATLATRARKTHHGETEEQRLDRWEREARTALAGGLAKVARTALRAGQRARGPAVWSPGDVVARALERVGRTRATWSRSDLLFAVSEALPGPLGLQPERVGELLESLTDRALDAAVPTKEAEPVDHLADEFRLADGTSAFQAPGSARYACPDQVAAEHTLAAAGVALGATALTEDDAAAVVDRFAENGRELGADQAAAVRGVLSSGAKVEVLAAAAGAGKSFVVGAISEAWAEHGHRTLGLAPSQVAAEVLRGEGVRAVNLAAWRSAQERLAGGRGRGQDEELRLRAGDLLVIDEAGMAATEDLAAVVERAEAAGAKVLLVGDARQLRAVGPGGALSDVGARARTYTLTEVRRFRRRLEGEASLRLREADPTALEWYDRHGHIRDGGTVDEAERRAARGWLADTLDGRESLLIVGTNEQAARVSAMLRAELVALGRVEEGGLVLGRDGTTAGVGDVVQARRNGWDIADQPGNARAPINRETYRVTATWADGSMTVQDRAGVEIRLPASYVQADVALAYACTVHGAQGRTVDTAHSVVEAQSGAEAVYVQATRGRDGNTMYVVTRATASDAPVGEAATVEPRAALAVVAEVLEKAEQQQGALAEREAEQARMAGEVVNVDRLAATIAHATAGRFSGFLDGLVHDGALSEEDRAGLAADHRSIGALERLVRQVEVAGHDPAAVLRDALDGRPLTGARAPAQVLHARIRDEVTDLAAPVITSYRDLIPADTTGRLRGQMETFAAAADDRRRTLGAQAAAEAPGWAVAALGPVPTEPLERADWETRAGWAAAHRENLGITDSGDRPIGEPPAAGLAEKRAVWATAQAALRLPDITPAEDAMSDGQLRARVAGYERERVWAPRYVADELAATAEAEATLRQDAQVWAARAAASGDTNLAAEATAAAEEAGRLAGLLTDLAEIEQARARWYALTAVSRDLAERSRAALLARGVDVADPGDRVTAEEWLAEHAAEQRVAERWRPITSADVLDDPVDADELSPADLEHAADVLAADIRDLEARDTSEDTDPERAVPTAEQVAQALEKTRRALLEIALRHAEDAARDDAYRAEEMAWWAGEDDTETAALDDEVVWAR